MQQNDSKSYAVWFNTIFINRKTKDRCLSKGNFLHFLWFWRSKQHRNQNWNFPYHISVPKYVKEEQHTHHSSTHYMFSWSQNKFISLKTGQQRPVLESRKQVSTSLSHKVVPFKLFLIHFSDTGCFKVVFFFIWGGGDGGSDRICCFASILKLWCVDMTVINN